MQNRQLDEIYTKIAHGAFNLALKYVSLAEDQLAEIKTAKNYFAAIYSLQRAIIVNASCSQAYFLLTKIAKEGHVLKSRLLLNYYEQNPLPKFGNTVLSMITEIYDHASKTNQLTSRLPKNATHRQILNYQSKIDAIELAKTLVIAARLEKDNEVVPTCYKSTKFLWQALMIDPACNEAYAFLFEIFQQGYFNALQTFSEFFNQCNVFDTLPTPPIEMRAELLRRTIRYNNYNTEALIEYAELILGTDRNNQPFVNQNVTHNLDELINLLEIANAQAISDNSINIRINTVLAGLYAQALQLQQVSQTADTSPSFSSVSSSANSPWSSSSSPALFHRPSLLAIAAHVKTFMPGMNYNNG